VLFVIKSYKDDELREFVKTERLRLEKEKQIQFAKEEKEREMDKLRFEAQKIEAERAEKQKERKLDAEKLRLEMEERQKEKDREAAQKRKDREAEMERVKLETERMKLEAERLKVDAEERTKQRELELKMRELETSVNAQRDQNNTEIGSGDSARPQMARMKALKLPPYNEDKDDLDAYLSRFQRACQAFDVKPEHWSTQLARFYKVKPWMCISRCWADHDVGEYHILKENLLKRFRLTRREATVSALSRARLRMVKPLSSLSIDSGGIFRSGATWQVLSRLMKVWRA